MDHFKLKKKKSLKIESESFFFSYPFLCEQFAGLLQVLCCLIPYVGMMAQHQQALLIGKHHCNKEHSFT